MDEFVWEWSVIFSTVYSLQLPLLAVCIVYIPFPTLSLSRSTLLLEMRTKNWTLKRRRKYFFIQERYVVIFEHEHLFYYMIFKYTNRWSLDMRTWEVLKIQWSEQSFNRETFLFTVPFCFISFDDDHHDGRFSLFEVW